MLLLYSALIIFTDQLSKYLIRAHLLPYEKINILSNFFAITNIKNTGAAFGILEGQRLFFIFITIFFLIFLFYLYKNELKNSKLTVLSTAFLIGGSLSNLIDRIIYSYVTDFIAVRDFPVINIADIFIFFGVLFLIIHFIFFQD